MSNKGQKLEPGRMRDFLCRHCGARFSAFRKTSRYCGVACRVAALRARRKILSLS